MKICVVSDSHGDSDRIDRVVQAEDAVCDAYVHLGDIAQDAQRLMERTQKPVCGVRGNCDFFLRAGNLPEERLENLGGTRLLICHGHRYDVKHGYLNLYMRARELEARCALFGHTHSPLKKEEGSVLLLNPGALCDGRYMRLTVQDGDVQVEYRYV